MRFSILIALFFVLLGASILLNVFFKIHFPFVRVAFALVLIYGGVSLLFGLHERQWRDEDMSVFGVVELKPHDLTNKELNVIFGKGTLDLSELRAPAALKLNVVFGEAVVRFDPSIPLQVKSNGAFSETRLPDGNRVSFGEMSYRSKSFNEAEPAIVLEVSTVFGATKFEAAASPGLPLSRNEQLQN
jgi:hypothetical protein